MLAQLYEAVAQFPRVPLATLPTPLEPCPRLSAELGGPKIYVKRDDLTGLALGGNKVRALEFRLGEALRRGADTVLLAVEATSNSARQTAAACCRLGLDCILFLRGSDAETVAGNLLIDHLLAEAHLVPAPTVDGLLPLVEAHAAVLKKRGRRPFILNTDPVFSLGSALGYALAFAELVQQAEGYGFSPTHVYLTSGGRSLAGLMVGSQFIPKRVKLVGISAVPGLGRTAAEILPWAEAAFQALGLARPVQTEDVESTDNYAGDAYGVPTRLGDEALRLVARLEGLLLDPVYTAKGMSGLIDHVRKGRLGPDDHVVFIHTGGLPALFHPATAPGMISTDAPGSTLGAG